MQRPGLEAEPTLADTNGHVPSPQSQTQLSGAEILDKLLALLCEYCVLPSWESEIGVVLWCAATHALPVLPCAPRLAITSPTKGTGKTRLLEIIAGVCYEPLRTASATAPAIFRTLGVVKDDLKTKDDPPTLFMDEADTIFGPKRSAEHGEDLRGLLNCGYQRNWPVKRCERRGGSQVVLDFQTFAMAALAGIGELPDTITDRAVNVPMRKRKASEPVSPFRERRDRPKLDIMREQLQAWLSDPSARESLKYAEPSMAPLEDRAADVWEPLIMVADLAGGDWPDLARKAAQKLVADAKNDDQVTLSTQAIHDIHDVFTDFDRENGVTDFLASQVLVSSLKALEGSPWSDYGPKGLTQNGLARLLRDFRIRPHHNTTRDARGYARSLFVDAWERYPPPSP